MDYKDVCEKVIAIAKEAGDFISKRRGGFTIEAAEAKSLNNFVTDVDKGAEKIIVEGLTGLVDGAGFIVEENTVDTRGDVYNWIVDPLDGTTNFLHSLPPFSVSIALTENNKTVVGVVLEVVSKECFYAYKGGHAFLDGREIQVSSAGTVKDSLIATGFPYFDFNKLEKFLKTLDYFFHHSHGIRRLGSAAIDLAYVACGRFESFYEYNLNAWDVAAGAFIVEMAGGQVSDFKGGDDYIFGKEILASNSKTHEEFLQVINNHFND